jgi:hypothetical protein
MFCVWPTFAHALPEIAPPPAVDDAFKARHHQEYRPTLFPNDTGESVTPVTG